MLVGSGINPVQFFSDIADENRYNSGGGSATGWLPSE